MQRTAIIGDYLKPALFPAACVMLVAFFAWHAMAGDNGVFALGEVRAEQSRLQAEAAEAEARHTALSKKLALLGDRVEPDYAEQLVRERLGVVREDEIVVPLD